MSVALSVPSECKAILLHPVSYDYNIATDLNMRMYAGYPDAWADITAARYEHAAHPWHQDSKQHVSRLTPNSLSPVLIHVFCIKRNTAIDLSVLSEHLQKIRSEHPGRTIYVPAKFGFLYMDNKQWQELLKMAKDILESGRWPCRVKIWAY